MLNAEVDRGIIEICSTDGNSKMVPTSILAAQVWSGCLLNQNGFVFFKIKVKIRFL